MSIQSDWQPAMRSEPAEFDLDYVNIKVQAMAKGAQIHVRIATAFNTDWQERKFDEWCEDMEGASDVEEAAKLAYPVLKEWRDCVIASGDGKGPLGELNDLLRAIEQDPGVIRG